MSNTTYSNRLEDQAASTALNSQKEKRRPPVLDEDGKLSSASAAMSLKYAQAQDLPSFPSAGLKLSSAGAAASIADSNKKSFEHWKSGPIPAANKAAMLAKDYEMDPLWQPELSAAGSKAALLAHKDTTSPEIWKSQGTEEGQSAAGRAVKVKSPNAITERDITAEDRRKALLAATGAMSGSRPRAGSTPTSKGEPSNWALKAATSSQRAAPNSGPFTTGDPGFEAARIQNQAKSNVNRQLYGSTPPVALEVEEKNRQDMLRASAVAMAKKMYAIQQSHIDEAAGVRRNDSKAAANSSHRRNLSESSGVAADEPTQTLRYENLEEAARKLAQERLAKMRDEHAEYRQYYGASSTPTHSRLSMRFRRRGSTGSREDSSDDDDEQPRRIRKQMSTLQSQVAEVDNKKRQADRNALLEAAQRNVQARMAEMDERVFQETGKANAAQKVAWEREAREKAQISVDKQMENVGKVHIGGGKYLDQSEIDAIARARLQPTLDEINETAERQRARDTEIRLEAERAKEQMAKEKAREAAVKAEMKAVQETEKAEARKKKADEKQAAKEQAAVEKERLRKEKEEAKQEKAEAAAKAERARQEREEKVKISEAAKKEEKEKAKLEKKEREAEIAAEKERARQEREEKVKITEAIKREEKEKTKIEKKENEAEIAAEKERARQEREEKIKITQAALADEKEKAELEKREREAEEAAREERARQEREEKVHLAEAAVKEEKEHAKIEKHEREAEEAAKAERARQEREAKVGLTVAAAKEEKEQAKLEKKEHDAEEAARQERARQEREEKVSLTIAAAKEEKEHAKLEKREHDAEEAARVERARQEREEKVNLTVAAAKEEKEQAKLEKKEYDAEEAARQERARQEREEKVHIAETAAKEEKTQAKLEKREQEAEEAAEKERARQEREEKVKLAEEANAEEKERAQLEKSQREAEMAAKEERARQEREEKLKLTDAKPGRFSSILRRRGKDSKEGSQVESDVEQGTATESTSISEPAAVVATGETYHDSVTVPQPEASDESQTGGILPTGTTSVVTTKTEPMAAPSTTLADKNPVSPNKRDSRVKSWFKNLKGSSKTSKEVATNEPKPEVSENVDQARNDSMRDVAMAGRETDDLYGSNTYENRPVSPIRETEAVRASRTSSISSYSEQDAVISEARPLSGTEHTAQVGRTGLKPKLLKKVTSDKTEPGEAPRDSFVTSNTTETDDEKDDDFKEAKDNLEEAKLTAPPSLPNTTASPRASHEHSKFKEDL